MAKVELTPRWLVAAIGLPLLACVLQEALWSVFAPFAWILFYPVAFWAPSLASPSSGVVATLLSGGLAFWRFVPESSAGSLTSLGVFLVLGFSFSGFHHHLRRAEQHAATLRAERQKLQIQSLAQFDLLQGAIECINDPFWIYDATDTLVLFNGAYRELSRAMGVDATQGMAFRDIYVRAEPNLVFDSAEERAAFRAARLAAKGAKQDSYDFRLKDGRNFLVNKRQMLDGSVVHIGFNRTLERQREHALQNARLAAESANRSKTEFLTSMSHELRTPMNAVLGFAQLMQRDKKTPLSDRHQDMIGHVLEGGQHLLSLIDDVLDLARIESESVGLSLEPVDLDEALRNVLTTLKPVAEKAQVALSIDGLSNAAAHADRRRMLQLVLNLASNAIKYNHAGGKVTLKAEALPGRVRVSVSDDGMGVPEEARDKLFQPFYRAGRETGTINGTGIGLTITQRLAELMGGAVGYEPLETGSRFWVELPRSEVELTDTRTSNGTQLVASAPPPTRGTLLYVEDNPANLQLLRAYVATRPELRLVCAESAELGLRLAASQPPDLLLLDINLPGMSGLQALPLFRELPGMAKTPAIAVSASAFQSDRERAKNAGFDAYLSKPLALDELEKRLARWLGDRRSDSVHPVAQAE